MKKISEKEIKNIICNLHESEFIDYKIEANNLILRVAINCAMAPELGVESEYGEKYYMYDIICHNYKDLTINSYANGESLIKDERDEELFFKEIGCFKVVKNKYYFQVQRTFSDNVDFWFDCDYVEWKPIDVVLGDDLYYIDGVAESYQFK